MSVNVYGYDKIPYPYYISEFVKKLYHVDVLLHNNHYYLIRNMSTFASGEKSNRIKCYVCQYCLCYFVKKERYDLHVELCVKGGHQYEFPHKDAAQLNFSNYSNIVPASFVMYCDLEDMITKEVLHPTRRHPTRHNDELTWHAWNQRGAVQVIQYEIYIS